MLEKKIFSDIIYFGLYFEKAGGLFLENIDIINKIIEVEHEAQRIANEAESNRAHLDERIKQETENLRLSYEQCAEKRIQMVRESEHEAANEQIRKIDDQLREKMHEVETTFASNRKRWIDDLFATVVGNS